MRGAAPAGAGRGARPSIKGAASGDAPGHTNRPTRPVTSLVQSAPLVLMYALLHYALLIQVDRWAKSKSMGSSPYPLLLTYTHDSFEHRGRVFTDADCEQQRACGGGLPADQLDQSARIHLPLIAPVARVRPHRARGSMS